MSAKHNQEENQKKREAPSAGAEPESPTTAGPDQSVQSAKDDRIKELEDQYLRLRADFDNFRKRSQTEREELAKFANELLIMALLPVLDNFNRAMISLDDLDVSPELDKVVKGVALVHRQLEDIMSKAGLAKIDTAGQHFDPFYHEAALDKKTDTAAAGTILEELQTGYLFQGKVIRPAMVVVAKKL